ncbi:MAG: hypothetical protein M3N59_03490, partial [bacterium]|nr:hypothetical protein [bacterium]
MGDPKPLRAEAAEPTPLFTEGDLVLERYEMAAGFVRKAKHQFKRGNPGKAFVLSVMAAEADPYPYTEMAEVTRSIARTGKRHEMRHPLPKQISDLQDAIDARFPDPGDRLESVGEAQTEYTEEQVELPLATGMLGAFLADSPDALHPTALMLRRDAFTTAGKLFLAQREAELQKEPSVSQITRVELIERLARKHAIVGINGSRNVLERPGVSSARFLRGEREMLETCAGILTHGGWSEADFQA